MHAFQGIPPKADLRALLQSAGGESGLVELLRDFYQRMSKDTLIGFFFTHKDLEDIVQKQKAFLLKIMGATKTYSGKPPGKAHGNLPPIRPGHFDRRMELLRQTLTDHKLPKASIETWVDFERAFRDKIVTPEKPLQKTKRK